MRKPRIVEPHDHDPPDQSVVSEPGRPFGQRALPGTDRRLWIHSCLSFRCRRGLPCDGHDTQARRSGPGRSLTQSCAASSWRRRIGDSPRRARPEGGEETFRGVARKIYPRSPTMAPHPPEGEVASRSRDGQVALSLRRRHPPLLPRRLESFIENTLRVLEDPVVAKTQDDLPSPAQEPIRFGRAQSARTASWIPPSSSTTSRRSWQQKSATKVPIGKLPSELEAFEASMTKELPQRSLCSAWSSCAARVPETHLTAFWEDTFGMPVLPREILSRKTSPPRSPLSHRPPAPGRGGGR